MPHQSVRHFKLPSGVVNEGGLDVLMKCARTQNRPEVRRSSRLHCKPGAGQLRRPNSVARASGKALFIMATHEEHACVWKSAGGALKNFAEVYPEKKNFVRIR